MTSEAKPAAATTGGKEPILIGVLRVMLNALSWLGGVWLIALIVLVCSDVVGRSFFNAPITGVAEIAAFSIIGIVCLQLPETILHNRLTRTDLFIAPLHANLPRLGSALEALFALAGVAVFLVIFRGSLEFFEKSLAASEFYGVQGVFTFPTWPIRLILLVGVGASAIAFLVRFAFALGLLGGSREAAELDDAGHIEGDIE